MNFGEFFFFSAYNCLQVSVSKTRSHVQNSSIALDDIEFKFTFLQLNSFQALQNKEIDSPPSYDEAVAESFYDPRGIREQLSSTGLSVGEDSGDLVRTIDMIQNAKVIIAFLSDQYVQ